MDPIILVASTYASPSSIPFQDLVAFLLMGASIVAGIIFYFKMRRTAI